MSRPLIVALHGVGSSGSDMATALVPLGSVADVIALNGTDAFDGGQGRGRQWFSIAGVTEANRPMRVAEALPALLGRLNQLADQHGVARNDLVLLGFSQGAIMTLAMIAQGLHPGRGIAVAGRLAAPVLVTGDPATLLVVHDRADQVMPLALSDDIVAKLAAAGHHVDLVYTEGIGHGIGAATIKAITSWLTANSPSASISMQTERRVS
jgi:phospholipase/carboxylesterase